MQEVLGPVLGGVYLYGSAVAGGLKPESDLDLLVVTTRRTTEKEKEQLFAGLLGVSGRPRHVEVTVVVASEVRPWRYPPRIDFQYGDWLREEFERGNRKPWPTRASPDLTILLTMARQRSRTLLGPDAAEMLDPVPRADLERAVVAVVDDLLAAVDWDGGNVVLTLARIWVTLETGKVVPKDSAADWAHERLPAAHRAVLARARATYLGEEGRRWQDFTVRVRPCALHLAGEIDRLRAARGAS